MVDGWNWFCSWFKLSFWLRRTQQNIHLGARCSSMGLNIEFELLPQLSCLTAHQLLVTRNDWSWNSNLDSRSTSWKLWKKLHLTLFCQNRKELFDAAISWNSFISLIISQVDIIVNYSFFIDICVFGFSFVKCDNCTFSRFIFDDYVSIDDDEALLNSGTEVFNGDVFMNWLRRVHPSITFIL